MVIKKKRDKGTGAVFNPGELKIIENVHYTNMYRFFGISFSSSKRCTLRTNYYFKNWTLKGYLRNQTFFFYGMASLRKRPFEILMFICILYLLKTTEIKKSD